MTEELRARHNSIPPKLNEIFAAIKRETPPLVDIGPQCSSPNDCPFTDHCWAEKSIPNPSVFDLPGIRDKKWELYSNGILTLSDPRLSGLTPAQQRAVEVFKSKKRFVDSSGIKTALENWKFPLVFLDFETINPAIPRYDKTGPYQQVPFQFSAHIWNSPDSELVHKEYLHTDSTDPRPTLIPKLLESCFGEGSIVAYYSAFEKGRITELADFDENKSFELLKLNDRFVDPLPIFREFVYDNGFEGSFSLKAVAPSILGKEYSYDGMLVSDGSAAQRAFEEIINPSTNSERRSELISASIEYCKKDTLMMVDLVKWLRIQSGE